jgi:hypothetical protein
LQAIQTGIAGYGVVGLGLASGDLRAKNTLAKIEPG